MYIDTQKPINKKLLKLTSIVYIPAQHKHQMPSQFLMKSISYDYPIMPWHLSFQTLIEISIDHVSHVRTPALVLWRLALRLMSPCIGCR